MIPQYPKAITFENIKKYYILREENIYIYIFTCVCTIDIQSSLICFTNSNTLILPVSLPRFSKSIVTNERASSPDSSTVEVSFKGAYSALHLYQSYMTSKTHSWNLQLNFH